MLRWNWHYIKIKIHIIYTIYFPRALLYRQTNIHEKLFVFQGNCLELGAYGVLNQVKCENFTGGSPVSPYLSDVIYRCMFMIFIIEIEIKKDIWEFNLFFFLRLRPICIMHLKLPKNVNTIQGIALIIILYFNRSSLS